jgi:hypothetical protein
VSGVRELKLSEFGLETVEDAAGRRNQHPTTIRKLVADGAIPAVVIGTGRSARYLVRPKDVDAVPVRKPGAPVDNANAVKKKPGRKPGKKK